ncbi:MAG: hypothetical protein HN948_09020 [Clostridia bacterium]|jgi:microcompartment protein CcmK/EutM|nr:hypothetical protein [Clostridia bacterium]MBT7123132.1 hypothetical protein [Clostridia bacterium]
MLIGEVLGNVDCTVKNEELRGLKLKVVRLYKDGRADRVVVAGDEKVAPENGDFVVLEQSQSRGLTITDFLGENVSPYINEKINMKIS